MHHVRHVSSSQIVIDIMAKNMIRERVRVEASDRQLHVVVTDENRNPEFALPVTLWGKIVPSAVSVEVKKPKFEVIMRKADLADWKDLHAPGSE